MSNAASSKNPVLTPQKKKRRGFGIKSVARRLSIGQGNAASSGMPAQEPLRYEADDIEEANRIGAAIRRQHAR
jgi:hypothetical protein